MISADDVAARLTDELSTPRKIRLVALILLALGVSGAVGSLLLTEPGLPLRTQAAFGAIVAIGASWVGFGVWALSTRRALYARQQVVATRLALVFGLLYTIGCLVLLASGVRAAGAAAAFGGVLTMIAWWLQRRASDRLAGLLARRQALEAGHGR
ncbi:MAG TPA: hypothetical protein VFV98_03780 [Vicinamibacterales bacterium]|nr:hypothetical protein [Vicinamibacterales bacterium]